MMSSGTQVELDWAGMDAASGAAASQTTLGAIVAEAKPGAYLTDEELLGIDPPSPKDGYGGQAQGDEGAERAETHRTPEMNTPRPADPGNTNPNAVAGAGPSMPEWMVAAAGDPKHGAEAQRLWQEHQAFRASFSSPDEARAMKELFPGGAQEAQTLRQAAQAVDQLDAAIYSEDARAQSEVVTELARANPAAFRQLCAEAEKVLAGMGQAQPVRDQTPTLRETREGWGTQPNPNASQDPSMVRRPSPVADHPSSRAAELRASESRVTDHQSPFGSAQGKPVADHPSAPLRATESPVTNHESRVTNHAFDPSAYAAFERSTNDTVARDVRVAVGDTLARVLPEGIAEGAARRIGEDIFNEIHRTLAADRTLSEQVGEILRGSSREFTASGWRFGTAEQQRVAALLAGRAKQLVPGVSRRVIGEWTSSVLGASRSKAARQASAASRVDIAAPGGSLDSMPLRAMSSREINYASMSDDQILGM